MSSRASLRVVSPINQAHFDDPWHPKSLTMNDSSMNEISRPELDAKLEAIEARLETKIVRIEGKLDVLVESSKQTSSDAKSLKLWIGGLIATVIIAAVSTVDRRVWR